MKKYSVKQRIVTLINGAIFLAFLVLVFTMFADSRKTVFDWGILIVCLGVFLSAVYYEYLRHLYNDALYTLNFRLDPELAEAKYRRLCRLDFTKNYEKNNGIFEVMLAIEQQDAEKALALIDKNEKRFRSSVELLIIMYYYQIRAYLLLGNTKKVNAIYSEAQIIEKMKKRPNIINYHELEGLHELALGNRKKALAAFKEVNVSKMNPKEMLFITSQLAELSAPAERAEYRRQIANIKGVSEYESQ